MGNELNKEMVLEYRGLVKEKGVTGEDQNKSYRERERETTGVREMSW